MWNKFVRIIILTVLTLSMGVFYASAMTNVAFAADEHQEDGSSDGSSEGSSDDKSSDDSSGKHKKSEH
ncbi:MAG: hypothetical protein HON76_15890 [Candidatus Scalindua sp.]|jgi:hypothetical protein|nr:hypothetical protein [Candidatus Scalindua sp.]